MSIISIHTHDEKELIRQLLQESSRKEAYTRMVKQYSQPLYWQIRRMVYSHADTDDILQNTFIKAWCNIDTFRGDSKLSTWLYRIAVNETFTFIQKQREVTSSLDIPLARQLEADEYFDGDKTDRLLQEAIATLPDKQRLVFNMKYFENMKYEDMSHILQTSVGALKASYHHAVRKIHDFLELQ
ncbi:MAG: sigma-70 family RNA polymerase sigma factor [Clostridium sp.]|nr:sigma-70 family RNA polymerase sigma factor [Clostridium sp.]